MNKKIVITGGAGYIGSVLTGVLLRQGFEVVVIDKLLFGGDHMLCYKPYNFNLYPIDVMDGGDDFYLSTFRGADAVIHLAALVGFPACDEVTPDVARRYNVESVKRMYNLADKARVPKFLFSSTYSVYGNAPEGVMVDEESPLNPQSLYGETKIDAERYLLSAGGSCRPLIFRFATLFGLSPRTRFDLIINQFVLEAMKNGKLVIYQKNFRRSYCHITDIIRTVFNGAVVWGLEHYDQIWNVGSSDMNLSKNEIVDMISKHIPMNVEYKDLEFQGDMRDIAVSYDKINKANLFEHKISVELGILELKSAISCGLIYNPMDSRHRNANPIIN